MEESRSASSSYSPIPTPLAQDLPLKLQTVIQPGLIKGEETPDSYRCGGYRRVIPGEKLKEGRYEVIRKLGFGEYSTVWLVFDHKSEQHVALKIFKSDLCYWNAAKQEWLASSAVDESARKLKHPAARHILHVRDFFEISGSTYPSEVHPCIVADLYGEHLYSLNKRIRRLGLALDMVRKIARQLLVAVDFLHREAQLVHTDIKPENILVRLAEAEQIVRVNLAIDHSNHGPREDGNVVPSQPLKSPLPAGISAWAAVEIERERSKESCESLSPSRSPLSSLTLSSPCSSLPSFILENSTSLQEVIEGTHDSITQSLDALSMAHREDIEVVLADLGSAVADTPTKKNCKAGTREYRAPELYVGCMQWSSKVDIWALGCTIFEIATGEALFPKPNYRNKTRPPWSMEQETMMMMLELLCLDTFPTRFVLSGKEVATLLHTDGSILDASLRRSRKDMSLRDVLTKHFSFPIEAAQEFSAFLLRMLSLDPNERASAAELLQDPFLKPR